MSGLAVPALGLSRLGLSRLGLSRLGVRRLGLSWLGLSRLGLSRLGVRRLGLSRLGLSRLGVRGPGVLAAGVLVAVLAGCGAASSVSPVGQSTTTPTTGPTGTGTGVAGTGAGGAGGTATTPPIANGPVAGPTSGSGAAATRLKIVYNDGAGQVSTWSLTCDPTGGSHPHAALACRTLAAHGKAGLAPIPRGVMCPQIFSGAQTATITGTWNGATVNATLDRRDGCQTGRWRALQGLLPNVPVNGVQ